MASSRPLHFVQQTTWDRTALVTTLPIRQSSIEIILSWEHFDAQLILPSQEPVHLISWWEQAKTKITKGGKMVQRNGDLHIMEPMKEKE
jgi:hypothetical protein